MKVSVVEVRPVRARYEKATLYTDMYSIHYFSRNNGKTGTFLLYAPTGVTMMAYVTVIGPYDYQEAQLVNNTVPLK